MSERKKPGAQSDDFKKVQRVERHCILKEARINLLLPLGASVAELLACKVFGSIISSPYIRGGILFLCERTPPTILDLRS